MENTKTLFEKDRNVISYGVFGILTTAVNIAVYWLMAHPVGLKTVPSTVTAWVAAVLFAYVTNRKWVFHSEAHTWKEIRREIASFFVSRLSTGVLDWVCMLLFVDFLWFNDVKVKVLVNVMVIILNYIISKRIVFRSKNHVSIQKHR